MLIHKPFSEISGGDLGWLTAKHHFALGPYGNPEHLPLGKLYVLNDDRIAPYSGFPVHGHRDVEIVSYVRSGTLTHEDGLGNKGHLQGGDVQVMSAGTGIRHAEYNEGDAPLHLFQIWFHPRAKGMTPRWDIRAFSKSDRLGHFVPLASGYDTPGALEIHADAQIHGAVLRAGTATSFDFRPGHSGYIVPVSGTIVVDRQQVEDREGLVIRGETSISIDARTDAEVILIETTE